MSTARRFLAVLGGALLVLLALAAAFRAALLEPLLLDAARTRLGLEATVDGIRGSVVAGLELEGVKARGAAEPRTVAAFEAARLAARYSLPALLRGTGAFLATVELTIAGGRLELDLAAPKPAATPAPTAAGPAPATGDGDAAQPPPPHRFPTLPRLTVRDLALLVRGGGYAVEISGLEGDVSHADAAREQTIQARARSLSLRHPALRAHSVPVAIDASMAPEKLALASAILAGEPLVESASLAFGDRRGDLDLEAALALWGGTAGCRLARRAGRTELRWDARGLDIRPDLVLANEALGALRGRVTTAGTVSFGAGGLSTLSGDVAVDWAGGQIAGRGLDGLSLAATVESGTALVREAAGRIGPNEVRLKGVALPAAPLFAGRWRELLSQGSAEFSATLGDVPAFLALWGVRAGNGAPVPEHRLLLDGRLDKGTVTLARGDLVAGDAKAVLEAATVTLPADGRPWGDAAFSGGAAVDVPHLQVLSTLLPLPPLNGSVRGHISGRGTLARPEGSAALTARGLSLAGRKVGDVELKAGAANGRIEVASLLLVEGANRLAVRDAHFSAAALAAPGRAGLVESLAGSFEARCADLPALATLAGLPPGSHARLPAGHLLTAAGRIDGRAVSLAAGSFAAAGATITIGGARIRLPSSWGAWRSEAVVEADLDVDVPDLGPVAPLVGLPPLQGRLRGRARISGSAAAPAGSVEASGTGLAFRGRRVGDATVKLSARPPLVRIESIEIVRGPDRLSARGSYDVGSATLSGLEANLEVADLAPWTAGLVPAQFPLSGRVRATLKAAGPLPGSAVDVDAEITDGAVQKVRAVRGTAGGQVTLDGAILSPRIAQAAIAVQLHGEAGERSGRVSFETAYEPGRLQVRALEAAGSGGLSLRGEGALPVDLGAGGFLGGGPLSLRASAALPHLEDVSVLLPPAYRLAGVLGAELAVSGTWDDPQVRLELKGQRLEFAARPGFVPPGPYTLAGTVTWSGAEARAEKVQLESAAFVGSLAGTWTAPPPPAALLSAEKRRVEGALDLRAAFASPDLGWLRGAAAGLRGVRGSVEGEVRVTGSPRAPQFSGDFRVADAAFRYGDLPPCDGLAARGSVEGRKIAIDSFGGNIGGAPFTLAGSVDLALPADPSLDLRLTGTNALLYRSEGLRIRADGDLTLRGPVSALSLAGEVALTDSVFQRTFSVVDLFSGDAGKGKPAKRQATGFAGISFPDPPLRDMRLDVHITALRPFRVITTLARGEIRPDLRLTGTGLLPVLRGPVAFSSTELVLPSGVMEFEQGSVIFREREPGRAQLEFLGRMQAQGHEIRAQVGGTLDLPEIILSSSPPLHQEELLLFVITGAPPGSATAEGGAMGAMAAPLAVYLGKGVVEKLFGGGPGLQNRFEVQVGRELTRSGGLTMESRLLLKKNAVRRGGSLYVTAEQDVYDQDNLGLKILFKFK